MIATHATPAASIGHTAEEGMVQSAKLIRKLRWIGLDDEANRLEQALRILAPEERGSVSAYPYSTD
jgi:hypothetical protein